MMTLSRVQSISALLGGPALLLPLETNEKAPVDKGWTSFTLARMDEPNYCRKLENAANIGVSLGRPSQGLCTIDADDEQRALELVEANPFLANTLQTTRVRGRNFWLRIEGDYPRPGKFFSRADRKIKFGEWRADGNQTVIHGQAMDVDKGETSPTAYRVLIEAQPARVPFSAINWPESWGLPWAPDPEEAALQTDRRLADIHGAAYTISSRGKLSLNSLYFVGRYAKEHHVVYEPSEGGFYSYRMRTGLWHPQTQAAVKIQFGEDLKDYADTQDPSDASQIVNARTDGFLSGLSALLQGQVEERDAFQRQPGVIHVGNGMVHLGTAKVELRPFAPEYRSRNSAPIDYDPTASCPRFKRELLDGALDAADVSLVQRYAGNLLLGRNLAQRILVLSGTAGGGKSTLLEIIEQVAGIENVAQLRTEFLNQRFEIARFVGKTLLTGKDVAGAFLETEGAHILKALVGHDLLSVERKGANGDFKVRGDFGVVITCNSRLRVRLDGDAEAWRRRLLLVRYERPKPEKPERDFANRLLAEEGPGILRWMVDGARAHLAELSERGDYDLTATQRHRVNALLAESDSVREFVRKGTENRTGHDLTVFELEEAYSGFCEVMGWEPVPVRKLQTSIGDAMQELRRCARRHDIQRDGKPKKGFSGVGLVEHAGEAHEV